VLSQLTVRDFAIVEHLDLLLDPGLTVLTGETGAGKSILVDALALAVGERTTSGSVRPGGAHAEVAAVFDVSGIPAVKEWLQRQALETEDEECVTRRTVSPEGRSRAFVNGRPVPLQSLRELGNRLLDIHGQHAHQSLVKPKIQRQILDAFGNSAEPLAEVLALYQRIVAIERAMEQLSGSVKDRDSYLALLQFHAQELSKLDLKPGELDALDKEQRRLSHAAELIGVCQEALAGISDDPGEVSALDRLQTILRRIEGIRAYDSRLDSILDLLSSAAIHLQEGASALRHHLQSLDTDPERLQSLEERLSTIHELARKHHAAPKDLPQLLAELRTEIEQLEGGENRLKALAEQHSNLLSAYRRAAGALSASRQRSASELARQITKNMQQLGMRGGQFAIIVEPLPNQRPTAFGLDQVEFTVSANPGQPPQPVGRIASGGELSRIALAIQTITAEHTAVPTLVFDEVDVGIGGRTAEIVGKALRTLGNKRQVLCLTHLHQVASQAHHHFQVNKSTEAKTTRTSLETLTGEARVREIARMMGGLRVTESALAHARELLEAV
jgi:DNA repair protein RecN (Recombination protein N)